MFLLLYHVYCKSWYRLRLRLGYGWRLGRLRGVRLLLCLGDCSGLGELLRFLGAESRQIDVEGAALAWFAHDPYAAVVELHKLAANKEAKAGATDGAGGGV